MDWLILGILANLLFSISNFIDKYLVENQFKKNIVGLVIISSTITILILPILILIDPTVLLLNHTTAFLLIINGSLFLLYLFPYLKALELADTSIVTSLFLLIPVIQLFLGNIFLGETITFLPGVGIILIIVGSILISLDFREKINLNKKVIGLMLISCFIIAVNDLIFKIFALEVNFITASFWQYTGYLLLGASLLLIGKYRKDLVLSIKKSPKFLIGLNLTNEIINLTGTIIRSFVFILVPLSIANIIGGVQPAFNLIIAIILTILITDKFNEDITQNGLIKKIVAIAIMIIGLSLIATF